MVRPTMVASNGKKSIAPTGTSSTQELIFKWFVATSLSQNGYGVAEQDLCRQLLRGISEMAEDVLMRYAPDKHLYQPERSWLQYHLHLPCVW